MPCHRVAPENIEAFVKQLERDGLTVVQLVQCPHDILVLSTTADVSRVEKRGAA